MLQSPRVEDEMLSNRNTHNGCGGNHVKRDEYQVMVTSKVSTQSLISLWSKGMCVWGDVEQVSKGFTHNGPREPNVWTVLEESFSKVPYGVMCTRDEA